MQNNSDMVSVLLNSDSWKTSSDTQDGGFEKIGYVEGEARNSVHWPYVTDSEAFGSILYKICLKYFGPEFNDWEPDTITIELKKEFDCPDINIDKILAFVSLANSFDGSFCFFNEVTCFVQTINALSNLESDYRFFGACVPQHINWAIYEVNEVFPGFKLDEEPAKFLGICYHKVGALLLPESLSEYQEFLDDFNENSQLVPMLKEKWVQYKDLTNSADIDKMDEDDIVEQQMMMLLADKFYMNSRKKDYLREHEILNE